LTPSSPIAEKLTELRVAFDQARAAPFSSATDEHTEDLLTIRVSRDAYAMKVSEITGLATDKKVVALPSPIPELHGLVGIRGALIPAYSLGALLGYAADGEQRRWLALCGTEDSFALVFSGFEGYVRVPWAELYTAEPNNEARTHIKQMVRTEGIIRGIVSVPSLLEAITKQVHKAVLVRSER
jgi:purine-binding chemotaxis protein CheW